MTTGFDMGDIKRRMAGATEALKKELAGLRTGRASVGLLDPVMVEAYGNRMPLNQVATVGAPEPRMLTVQVWDKGMVGAVDKAIRNAGLGLNPVTDGNTLRIPLPELTEDRRREFVKIAGKYTEEAKVAVRNVRRDAMDKLKKMEKDGEISQDEQKRLADDVQKTTDNVIKEIEGIFAAKEGDILKV